MLSPRLLLLPVATAALLALSACEPTTSKNEEPEPLPQATPQQLAGTPSPGAPGTGISAKDPKASPTPKPGAWMYDPAQQKSPLNKKAF